MVLVNDAQVAKWNTEGLPSDRMSAENAMILTHSARWPLMIDPQVGTRTRLQVANERS